MPFSMIYAYIGGDHEKIGWTSVWYAFWWGQAWFHCERVNICRLLHICLYTYIVLQSKYFKSCYYLIHSWGLPTPQWVTFPHFHTWSYISFNICILYLQMNMIHVSYNKYIMNVRNSSKLSFFALVQHQRLCILFDKWTIFTDIITHSLVTFLRSLDLRSHDIYSIMQ